MATIKYSNGEASDTHETIQAAMTVLFSLHPDAMAVDGGGFDVNEFTPDESYDIRNGRAAMVWATAEDAGEPGTGDDGANSIAVIEVEESDEDE